MSETRTAIDLVSRLATEFEQVGIHDVSRTEVVELAKELYERLENAVGEELVALCTTAQVDEFDRLMESGDEAGMTAFLRLYVPFNDLIVTKHVDLQIRSIIDAVKGTTA